MDRVNYKEKAASEWFQGRYCLGECLFDNQLGQLYLAHDSKRTHCDDGPAVLLHLFPDQAVPYHDMASTFHTMRARACNLKEPILPVLDFGWSGQAAFYVMQPPSAWAFNVLPALQQDEASSLHQQAIRITRRLLNSGALSCGLVPQAFLVKPGGIYLLGTALSEAFQRHQPQAELLSDQLKLTRKHGRHSLAALLAWGALTGLVLAGSGYYLFRLLGYAQQQSALRTPAANSPFVSQIGAQISSERAEAIIIPHNAGAEDAAPEMPSVVAGQSSAVSAAQLDRTENERNTLPDEIRTGSPASDPDKSEYQVGTDKDITPVALTGPAYTIVNEPERQIALSRHAVAPPEAVTVPASPNVAAIETRPAMPALQPLRHPLVQHTRPGPVSPVVVEPAPFTTASVYSGQSPLPDIEQEAAASEPATAPEAGGEDDASGGTETSKTGAGKGNNAGELTAYGMTSAELIRSAYDAIEQGKLGEEAGAGAIFFIRLLKRIDRGNPQIRRLAREVVAAYHVRARRAIKNQRQRAARKLLWMAGRFIKEFNLVRMNEAQQLLKHRLLE